MAQTPAFPTAEGYGKYAKGGRGGVVYEVTNLNDHGPGSLREAVEAKGARTVVFRVSGTIELERTLSIQNPYITIAGQTAPGDGICLNHSLSIDADHVVVRYLRVRYGDQSGAEADAISSRFTKNIILDHCSASWSVDETVSIYHCDSITVQWCIISASLNKSNHFKGEHGYGAIWEATMEPIIVISLPTIQAGIQGLHPDLNLQIIETMLFTIGDSILVTGAKAWKNMIIDLILRPSIWFPIITNPVLQPNRVKFLIELPARLQEMKQKTSENGTSPTIL
ncbi:MAG: hypothetical protein R2879_19720 [Saprospiraceae bacterium]